MFSFDQYVNPDLAVQDTSAVSELMTEGSYVPDLFRLFRFSQPSKLTSLVWTKPNSKEDNSNEIPNTARIIKGIRGYITHVRSGFMFYNSESKKVVCTTTGATVSLGNGVTSTHKDQMPIPFPLYSPVKYKSKEIGRASCRERV
jgi:hypothetical protein